MSEPMLMTISLEEYLALKTRAEAAEAEVLAWRECARYDALMSGPKFMVWDRSALDRCRRKYMEGG